MWYLSIYADLLFIFSRTRIQTAGNRTEQHCSLPLSCHPIQRQVDGSAMAAYGSNIWLKPLMLHCKIMPYV